MINGHINLSLAPRDQRQPIVRPYRDGVGPSKLLAKQVYPINDLVQGSNNLPKLKHCFLLVAPSKISCYRVALINV